MWPWIMMTIIGFQNNLPKQILLCLMINTNIENVYLNSNSPLQLIFCIMLNKTFDTAIIICMLPMASISITIYSSITQKDNNNK